MTHNLELFLLAGSCLLILSVAASTASSRFGIPALALFMLLGMLAGSDGIGGIEFDDPHLTRSVGTVALVCILFSGGLETSWQVIRAVFVPGLLLATLGVVLTAVITGAIAMWLLGIPILMGLLLGAIISSTDAAAVFGVLRARKLQLRGRLTPLLEFESGVNDPMAVFLTLMITGLIVHPAASSLAVFESLFSQLFIGLAGGFIGGYGAVLALNRMRIDYEGLYPVLSIASAMLTYGGTSLIGGSGFLAVYVAGVVIGSHNFIHKIGLIQFHDGIAWIMQIVVFITLGLLVFPSELPYVAVSGALLALIVIFIARPIAVFVSLFGRFDFRKKLFISWVGLRGAVPIVLATIPLTEGVPDAKPIFNVVFFIVLASVLIQGTSIAFVARCLGVLLPERGYVVERRVSSSMFEVIVAPDSTVAGRRVVDLNIPQGALIVLLTRAGESYVPRGATVLMVGDRLLIACKKEELEELRSLFAGVTA